MTEKALMNNTEKVICLMVITILLLSTILAISLVALLKERYLIPVLWLISPFILQYLSIAVYLWKGHPSLGGGGNEN